MRHEISSDPSEEALNTGVGTSVGFGMTVRVGMLSDTGEVGHRRSRTPAGTSGLDVGEDRDLGNVGEKFANICKV